MNRNQHKFTKSSVIEGIKTLMWVIPLTLLIWIYAEREQITDDPNIAFPITLHSSDANRVVTLLSPQDQNVTVTLAGPRAKLDDIKSRLTSGPYPTPLSIDVSSQAIGIDDRLSAPLLSAQPIFRDSGVIVKSCLPANLRIQFDEIVTRDAKVVLPPDVTNLESPPLFDPPTVTLHGPRSSLDEITRRDVNGVPTVWPDLTGIDAVRLPGTHDLPNIPLMRPVRDPRVTIEQKTVNLTLTVKQSSVEGKLPFVSIFPYAARSLLDEYKVELPSGDTLPNVKITGPADLVSQLVAGTLPKKPTAMLAISGVALGDRIAIVAR